MIFPSSCRSFHWWFGLVGLAGFTAVGGAEPLDAWSWRNPRPQGNVLYGVNYGNGQFVAVGRTGAIITSHDGVRWEARPLGITNDLSEAAFGLGRYWAVGSAGVLLSSPDGVAWTAQATGTTNSLFHIAYANNRMLVLGAQGTVIQTLDGSVWTKGNLADTNTLFGVTWGNGLYVAVGRTNGFGSSFGVIYSSPDAVNWTLRSQGQSYLPDLWTVAYGNSRFVARGRNGALMVSTNGTSWTNYTGYVTLPSDLPVLNFFGGQFLAMNQNGMAWVSTDGRTWTQQNAIASMVVNGLAWDGQTYVAVGGSVNGAIATCTNLAAYFNGWISRQTGFSDSIYSLLYDGRGLVGVGALGKSFRSEDGRRWTVNNMGTNIYFNAIAYGIGRYVAVGRDGWIMTSSNGLQWVRADSGTANRLEAVACWNGQFVAVGYPNTLLTSTDGLMWTNRSPTVNFPIFRGIAYADGLYAVSANIGRVYTSTNLENWSEINTLAGASLNDIAAHTGCWVAVGQNGAIVTSTNGLDWTVRNSNTSNGLVRVTFTGGLLVALGYDGILVTSPDGVSWTLRPPLPAIGLRALASGAGTLIVAGDNGTILQSDPLAQLGLRLGNGVEVSAQGQPGLSIRLECAESLAGGAGWQTLGQMSLSNAPVIWREQQATNAACRFYRAVLGP